MSPAPRAYGTKCKQLVRPTRKSEALYFGRYVSRYRRKLLPRPCISVDTYQGIGGSCCLQLHTRNQQSCPHRQGHVSDVKCLIQKCTNPGHQVTVEAAFIIILPKICGPSVRNWNHVTFLAPKILRWPLDLKEKEICIPILMPSIYFEDDRIS